MTTARLVPVLVLLIGPLLFNAGDITCAQGLRGVPVKIQITPVQGSGGRQIKVDLLDPANQLAATKKDLNLEIATKAQDGTTGKSVVAIKQGEMSATTYLPIAQASGIVEVTATSAQLADGGAVVKVSPAGHHPSPAPAPAPPLPVATVARTSTVDHVELAMATPPAAEPAASPLSGLAGANTAHMTDAIRHHTAEAGHPVGAVVSAAASRDLTSVTGAVPPPPPSAAANPPVQFDYYPKTRKLRADGVDFATVWAASPDDYSATADFQICFRSDLGPLNPEPIKILKGAGIGEAKLVSTSPGTIKVWYVWSLPPTQRPASPLTIEFTYPVWKPKLTPQQTNISLFDSVDIGVELAGHDDNPLPADEDRSVNIHIASGSGELSPAEVKLTPNDSHKTIRFTPKRPGTIHLVATTSTLTEGGADIVVRTPWGLLGCAAVGGLVGGLLAYWRKRGEKTWNRPIIGLITGVLCYWAALYVTDWLKLFHGATLNWFGVSGIGLVGGWLGTELITAILKKIGIGSGGGGNAASPAPAGGPNG